MARRQMITGPSRETATAQITLCTVAGLSDLEWKSAQAATRAAVTGWSTTLCDQCQVWMSRPIGTTNVRVGAPDR
jgi:hypothetical protein